MRENETTKHGYRSIRDALEPPGSRGDHGNERDTPARLIVGGVTLLAGSALRRRLLIALAHRHRYDNSRANYYNDTFKRCTAKLDNSMAAKVFVTVDDICRRFI